MNENGNGNLTNEQSENNQQVYTPQNNYHQGYNQYYNQYSNSPNMGQGRSEYGFDYTQSYDVRGSIRRTDAETYIRWSKIYGILNIIFGTLSCLSIIGALIGIPTILAGVRYQKSGQFLERSLLIGDETSVTAAFHELSRGIRISGILMLINAIILLLYLALLIVLVIIGINLPYLFSY